MFEYRRTRSYSMEEKKQWSGKGFTLSFTSPQPTTLITKRTIEIEFQPDNADVFCLVCAEPYSKLESNG